MKNKIIRFSFNFLQCFILFLAIMGMSFSVNIETFEYQTEISVKCSNYIGPVEFLAPEEFSPQMNTYFGGKEIFYKKGTSEQSFILNSNWYILPIPNISSKDLEKISDSNLNSELIIRNKNNLKLNFENPQKVNIDKIVLKVRDSNIDKIKLSAKNDENIPFDLIQNLFTYEIFLNSSYSSKNFELDLKFIDILKIEEILVYEKKTKIENPKFYFNLKDNCNETFKLYFGKFGDGSIKYYSKVNPHAIFDMEVLTKKNLQYSKDFDKDNIPNENDNCLNIKNPKQEDINFNKIGDLCEDFDFDGVLNYIDNCPSISNSNQIDIDKDGTGDACDNGGDNRFFEKNEYLVYFIIFVILMLFVGLSIIVLRKNN